LAQCKNCRTVFDAAALTLELFFDREGQCLHRTQLSHS
jgi:hypothetical protein